jgi:ABC-type uncharacterized transport system substrate-binding protein
MKLTSSIPIIVPGGTSPVERGWVKSLARPGGNVTGFAQSELSIIGKMLQTLKEIAPNLSHVAMTYNPDNQAAALFGQSFKDAAGPLAIQPIIAHIHDLADIERVIKTSSERPNGGIFFAPDVTVGAHLEQIVAIVARYRVPSIYSERLAVKLVARSITVRIVLTSTVEARPTRTVFFVANNPAICRISSRQSTNLSSTCGPQRRSASQCHCHSSLGPTR